MVVFAWALAVIFVISTTHHIRRPQELPGVIDDLGFPAVLAVAVVAAEAAVAVLLVLVPSVGAVAAIGYLLSVTAPFALAQVTRREVAECGCGAGPLNVRPGAPLLIRNVVLMALAGLALSIPTETPDLAVWTTAGVSAALALAVRARSTRLQH